MRLKVLEKKVSKWTLIRILKASEFSWRRVRKSLKSQRDVLMFDFFHLEIKALEEDYQNGKIQLWYYDESGVNLNPNSVYAWLPKGKATELPAQRGNVLTIAGFFQSDNTLQAYSHQGSMSSEIFVAYVEDFLKNNPPSMKTIVIIDNARGGVPLFSQIGGCQKENQAVASTKPIFSIFSDRRRGFPIVPN